MRWIFLPSFITGVWVAVLSKCHQSRLLLLKCLHKIFTKSSSKPSSITSLFPKEYKNIFEVLVPLIISQWLIIVVKNVMTGSSSFFVVSGDKAGREELRGLSECCFLYSAGFSMPLVLFFSFTLSLYLTQKIRINSSKRNKFQLT